MGLVVVLAPVTDNGRPMQAQWEHTIQWLGSLTWQNFRYYCQ
jgi:hypothetical protein